MKIKKYVSGTGWVQDYPEVNVSSIVATGTPSSSTFLRGDGQWATPAGVDNYVNITGDTMTGNLDIQNGAPTIKLLDTSGTDGYYLHANNGNFYILQDSTSDGTYDSIPFMMNDSGNVGIGTTSPQGNLHINSTNTESILHMTNTTSGTTITDGLRIGAIGNNALFLLREAGAMSFATSNTEKVRIDSAGNVGIGTTTPNRKVTIASEDETPLVIHRPNNSSTAPHGIGFSTRTGDAINSDSDIRGGIFYDYNGDLFLANSSSATNLASDPLSYSTLFIEGSNSNVGIGTTTPSAQLQVKSGATNRIPLIVDIVENATASLQEFKNNGTTVARINRFGAFHGIQVENVNSSNNSAVALANTGTTISRNVADTNPALIVNQVNAGSTGDLLQLEKEGVDVYAFTHDGTLKAPATFTIDPSAHGDATGKVIILGDLQVDGTTTTINSTTLEVDDKNIELSKGAANKAASDGAGISIDLGTDGSANLTYGATNDRFSFNKGLEVTSGNVGIGTTTPSSVLTLSQSMTSSPYHIFMDTTGTSTLGGGAGIIFGTSASATETNYNAKIEGIRTTSNDGSSELRFSTTDVTTSATPAERMRITEDGNVGIGTTSPSAQLQVKSGATNRVPLIVDTIASHAESLQVWRSNGSNVSRVSVGGYYVGSGIHNLSSANNSLINNDTTGTTISRNVADTNPALIVNLANASATGDIVKFQKAGTTVATVSNNGEITAPKFYLSADSDGANEIPNWAFSEYNNKPCVSSEYISDTYYPIYHEGNKPAVADVTGLQTALDGKAATSHTHAATDITSGTLDAARLPTILGTLEQVYSGTTTVTCTTASTVVTLTLDSGKSITATETLLLEVDAANVSTVSSYEKAYVMVRMGSNQSTTDTPFMSWSSLDSATTGNVRQWSALCRFSSTTSIQFRYGGYHLQTNTSSKTFGTFYVHRIWKVTN